MTANLATVLEKPGLLITRDPIDDDRSPETDPPDPTNASRRPAGGGQEAWDFSITSAFKLGPALPDPASTAGIFSLRWSLGRTHSSARPHSAPRQASLSVLQFLRQWAVDGPTLFVRLSRGSRVRVKRSGPIDGSDASFKVAQRISCTLHRENARAILKRAPEQMGSHCRSLGMSVLAESEQS